MSSRLNGLNDQQPHLFHRSAVWAGPSVLFTPLRVSEGGSEAKGWVWITCAMFDLVLIWDSWNLNAVFL